MNGIVWIMAGAGILLSSPAASQTEKQTISISFGHTSPVKKLQLVRLTAASKGLSVSGLSGANLEKDDRVATESLIHTGRGDVDVLRAELSWPKPVAPERKLASFNDAYTVNGDAMWGYLMKNGSPGQAERLRQDPFKHPDAPILTVQLNKTGTEGFSIGLEQLLRYGAMWLPEQDAFISIGNNPIGFNDHLQSLKGKRILDSVSKAPDATLQTFKTLWEDFGNPLTWTTSWQTSWLGTKGHLTVTAPAHGAIYKFAVDRWGNVRPDFASPHKFRLNLQWPGSSWKRQHIAEGLPVIITSLEKDGQHCEIEQFAAPLADPATVIRGYLPGVMLTKVKVGGKPGPFSFSLSFYNEARGRQLSVKQLQQGWAVTDRQSGDILLWLEPGADFSVKPETPVASMKGELTLTISGRQPGEFLVKLPSPAVPAADRLNAIDYTKAKQQTAQYWEAWLKKGAQFRAPEEAVNQLFRASLWHALILPRHTLSDSSTPHMDLPYANTAYGQRNAGWPVNQSVYVDYMLYGLRGYEQTAQDELIAMFRSQQQPDGRIAGFANWGVYSPAQLYAIAQHYLLSANKEQFEELLPDALKTLDWCLKQVAAAPGNGLILAPLNDLTHAEREWAFTQAYYVAGLALFAKALMTYGHPRGRETARIAGKMKEDVMTVFARASVKSPVVQLADGSWINYVPSDAMTPRRLMEEWYPTDVDVGPLHLSRLSVLPPYSWMATAMLHDHEDNLFLKNQGAANEPVYVQQGTAYLLRDEPEAAIRAFYSLMACGFSHEQLTSLEHRWAWGQYYGPPSTDGAWFELYRKMLIHEIGDDSLMIGQAIPRPWLEDGKQTEVKDAPTYFGPLSFNVSSRVAAGEISASIKLSGRKQLKMLLLRLRHPQKKPIRSVTVNGRNWKHFDSKKEYILIPAPTETAYTISARY